MQKNYYQKLKPLWEFFLLILVFLFVTTLMPAQQKTKSQEEDTPKIKEYVEVVNVEMVLRALRNGAPVGGLTEKDFSFKENGQPLKITSFTEVRRKIGERDVVELEDEMEEQPSANKKRFFLLYFWISDHSIDYDEPLDYFFDKVYQEGDIVMLVVKDNLFQITKPEDIASARQMLGKTINKIATQLQSTFQNAMTAMGSAVEAFMEEIQKKTPDGRQIGHLVRNINQAFGNFYSSYKRQYLNANFKLLINLADSLKDIPIEKWGLVFYQQSTVPFYDALKVLGRTKVNTDLDFSYVADMLRKIEMKIQRPMVARGHILAVQQAFIRANATFHMMIPEKSSKDQGYSDVIQMTHAYSDWQESFTAITKATGGDIITGNLLKTSLQKVIDREDVFYRITYQPRVSEKKKNKITIDTVDKNLKVFHVQKVDAKPLTNIQLADVTFKDSKLTLTIKNYTRISVGNIETGDVQLIISATDDSGEVVEFMKQLELRGQDATVSMKMNLPTDANITLMLTAWDNLSGLKAQHSMEI